MRRWSTLPLYVLAAVSFLLAPIAAAGQAADGSWTVPRTADGRPDLQGVWANNSATPLERPAQLADRDSFSDEEVASLAAAAEQAAARAARRGRTCDGPEDLPLQSRCITFGMPRVGGLGAGYNSYYQIFQTSDHLVLYRELIHDARVIPIGDRPHAPASIRQWHGDSRARWDGDTLVIETTNFDPRHSYRGASDNLHLVERLTRVGPETMHYEITVTDPTTWQSPWTALAILRKSEDAVYEYACHEGN